MLPPYDVHVKRDIIKYGIALDNQVYDDGTGGAFSLVTVVVSVLYESGPIERGIVHINPNNVWLENGDYIEVYRHKDEVIWVSRTEVSYAVYLSRLRGV